MKIVTLDVRAPGEAMEDFVRVWNTRKPERAARISFASPELLWSVHSDITALLKAGVLDRAEGGGVFFRSTPSRSSSCFEPRSRLAAFLTTSDARRYGISSERASRRASR